MEKYKHCIKKHFSSLCVLFEIVILYIIECIFYIYTKKYMLWRVQYRVFKSNIIVGAVSKSVRLSEWHRLLNE